MPPTSPSPGADPSTDAEGTDGSQSDSDSCYSGSEQSSDSLDSRYEKFLTENGRTYHSFKAHLGYWGPNDEKQRNAEDMCHMVYSMVMDGKLVLAPIKNNIQKALDLGCGTGIWAIEFADATPSASVLGIDLSPIQPPWVPPNCRFQLDDFTQLPWNFGYNYDLVHLRALAGCVEAWEKLYDDILHLKPGGFIEHVELSWTVQGNAHPLPLDSRLHEWNEVFREIGEQTRRSFAAHERSRECMERVGFVDVEEKRYQVPIGAWAKDPRLQIVGEGLSNFLLEGIEGFVLRGTTRELGWSLMRALVFACLVRNEIKNSRLHACLEVIVVYGRKP